MPLIRPEITTLLRRWAEVLAGLALSALGALGLRTSDSFLWVLALLVVLAGLGLAFVGWQRLRFRAGGTGAGLVQVVEGQIAFFGPYDGGFMGVQDVVELHLSAGGDAWVLMGSDGSRLHVPTGAQGVDALFDVFATLPGLSMAQVLAAREGPTTQGPRRIWRHPSRSTGELRLR